MGVREDGSAGDNIDVIRDLLRKLEQATAEAAATNTADKPEVAPPNPAVELASLKRAGSSLMLTPEGGREIATVGRPEPLASDLPIILPRAPGHKRATSILIGAGSFALGVAAAAAALVLLDPIRGWKSIAERSDVVASVPAADPRPTASRVLEPTKIASSTGAVYSGSRDTASQELASRDAGMPDAAVEPPARETPVAAPREAALPKGDGPAVVPKEATPEPAATVEPAVSPSSDHAAVAASTASFVVAVAGALEIKAGETRSLGLKVQPQPKEHDPLLVVLRGVPPWLSVSKGSTIGESIWLIPAHQAAGLALAATDGASGSASIQLQLAHLDGRILAEVSVGVSVSRAAKPSGTLQPSPLVAVAPEAGDGTLLRMLARGELLLDTGEIEAARLLFRTAAEGGNVAAALKLAQTYDPAEVHRLGMADTSADPSQAIRWYERAQLMGSPTAAARLAELSGR